MLSLPSDVIYVLAEWVCCLRDDFPPQVAVLTDTKGPAGGVLVGVYPSATVRKYPRAGYTLKSLILTCVQLRNAIYSRVLRKFFDNRAIKHVVRCNFVDYYSQVVSVPAKGQLVAAVAGNSPAICRAVIAKADLSYIEVESCIADCTKILLNKDLFEILIAASEHLFLRLWTHGVNKSFLNIDMIKCMLEIRNKHYRDVRLSGAGIPVFSSLILKSSEHDLAWTLIVENDYDTKTLIDTIKCALLTILSSTIIPWLNEEDPTVVLLNKIMSTYIFKHNWLQKEVLTANGTQNALIVYMCVKYGMDIILKSKIDFEVLKYYITNTIKDGEHISNAVLYNIITALAETPEIVDKLFTIAPICQFTLSQIENILYVLIPHTVYFMQVFSQEYVEPLHWCSNSTLELQLDAECAIRGLTLDDRAIIGMYMEDELSRHRARIQKVMSSMAKSVLHRRKTLGKWYISRISDQHSASANVLRYLKERSDGEKEQAEIDREQSRILLNWSQEHFDVAEWKHDGADEHDVQLKMNSGDTYDTELHDSADNSTETDNE